MQPHGEFPEPPAASGGAEDVGEADDLTWLLADDDPFVPPPTPAPPRQAVLPAATAPAPEPHMPASAASAPAVTPLPQPSPSRAAPTARTENRWSAVGSAFQPLPGGPLISPAAAGSDGREAVQMVADPGMTVHSVWAGAVEMVQDGGAPTVVVRAERGTVGYTGSVAIEWRVGHGTHVCAGQVLGVVAYEGAAERLSHLVLHVDHADGAPEDLVSWLAALPDPAELGLALDDDGIGTDPFLLDLRLAGHLGEPGAAT